MRRYTPVRDGPESQNLGAVSLLWQLGFLVLYCMMNAFVSGMMMPVLSYIVLNYFAAAHTHLPRERIECQVSLESEHCQAAVLDVTAVNLAIGMLQPISDIILQPAVGVLSDSFGRRRIMLIIQALSGTQILALCAASYGFMGVYVPLALGIFFSGNLANGVLNSACVDRIRHGPSRAAGMGYLLACSFAAHIGGMAMGYNFTLQQGVVVSVSLQWLAFLGSVIFLPETLSPRCARPLVTQSLLPGVSLRILWRTPVIRRLSLLAMLCSIGEGTFNRIVPVYLQRTVAWNLKDSYMLGILNDTSAFFWLFFLFKPLTESAGEMGAIIFSRVTMLAYGICIFLLTTPRQVMLLVAIAAGPMAFYVPSVSALKSRLVADHEQGALQGALGALIPVSGTLGSTLFGGGYLAASTSLDSRTAQYVVLLIITVVGCLPVPLMWELWRVSADAVPKERADN